MMSFLFQSVNAGYCLTLAIGQSFYYAASEIDGEEARTKVGLLFQFDIH